MDLTAIIRELLFSHDCVILPGFGGFIGNYSPARGDKATNTFYPPVKLISFNRNLNYNDGLLFATVSARTGLGYAEARNIVEEFVSDIKRKLGRGEKVVIDRIGSFTTNSEGNYIFEPDREVNYNLNSFGLTSFVFPPLGGYGHLRKLSNMENEGKTLSHNMRRYIWRAAVMIPIIGALIAVPLTTDVFKTKVQTSSLTPVTAVISDSGSRNVETVLRETDQLLQPPTSGNKAGEEITAAVNETSMPVSEDAWFVITGSFKSKANAEILAKKLADEGYSPLVIDAPNGFCRVSAVRCRTLNEALEIKNTLSAKYPGAWVKKGN